MNRKRAIENTAKIIFGVCGTVSVLAVVAITAYMLIAGTPALGKIGIKNMLFSTVWAPTAAVPKFGIAYIILTSLLGTLFAVLLGVPIAVLAAVFLSEIAGNRLSSVIKSAVELLAGIPSVIYGLLGILVIKPMIYRLEILMFQNDPSHRMTGGANMISAILVLAVMILPTVINVSETALRAVPRDIRASSYALGASKIQTVFRAVIPAASSGIITAVVLGVGRAIGEAMAITMVAGNAVNLPLPFSAVRFLTTGIVSEMSYAQGLHRQALFTIGLVLFAFIAVINIILGKILSRGRVSD